MAEYIDRAVAVSQAKFIHGRWGDVYVSAATLMGIPAADVAPVVHARWIEDASGIIICPECKRGYNLIAKFTNYCPACGAKMDGKEGANADNHD